jgi:hypothetical protein
MLFITIISYFNYQFHKKGITTVKCKLTALYAILSFSFLTACGTDYPVEVEPKTSSDILTKIDDDSDYLVDATAYYFDNEGFIAAEQMVQSYEDVGQYIGTWQEQPYSGHIAYEPLKAEFMQVANNYHASLADMQKDWGAYKAPKMAELQNIIDEASIREAKHRADAAPLYKEFEKEQKVVDDLKSEIKANEVMAKELEAKTAKALQAFHADENYGITSDQFDNLYFSAISISTGRCKRSELNKVNSIGYYTANPYGDGCLQISIPFYFDIEQSKGKDDAQEYLESDVIQQLIKDSNEFYRITKHETSERYSSSRKEQSPIVKLKLAERDLKDASSKANRKLPQYQKDLGKMWAAINEKRKAEGKLKMLSGPDSKYTMQRFLGEERIQVASKNANTELHALSEAMLEALLDVAVTDSSVDVEDNFDIEDGQQYVVFYTKLADKRYMMPVDLARLAYDVARADEKGRDVPDTLPINLFSGITGNTVDTQDRSAFGYMALGMLIQEKDKHFKNVEQYEKM